MDDTQRLDQIEHTLRLLRKKFDALEQKVDIVGGSIPDLKELESTVQQHSENLETLSRELEKARRKTRR